MDAAHRYEDTLNHEVMNEGGPHVWEDMPITMASAALGLLSSHPVATCCTLLLRSRNAHRTGSPGRHQKRKLPTDGSVSERQRLRSFAMGRRGLWA